jgi:hypothetical protein
MGDLIILDIQTIVTYLGPSISSYSSLAAGIAMKPTAYRRLVSNELSGLIHRSAYGVRQNHRLSLVTIQDSQRTFR